MKPSDRGDTRRGKRKEDYEDRIEQRKEEGSGTKASN
jgi:hypothetical protein